MPISATPLNEMAIDQITQINQEEPLMTTTKKPWKTPTLTHYGKLSELTQNAAGSVMLFTQNITYEANDEEFWDTNGDGKTDIVVVPAADGSGRTTQYNLTKVADLSPVFKRYSSTEPLNSGGDITIRDTDGDGNEDAVTFYDDSVWDSRDGVVDP